MKIDNLVWNKKHKKYVPKELNTLDKLIDLFVWTSILYLCGMGLLLHLTYITTIKLMIVSIIFLGTILIMMRVTDYKFKRLKNFILFLLKFYHFL